MTRVGPYEILRDAHRSGMTRGYIGQREGSGGGDEVFVKVFDPAVPLGRGERRRREHELLRQAKLQHKLAKLSSCWIAVLETGRGPFVRDNDTSMGMVLPGRTSPSSVETMVDHGPAGGRDAVSLDPAAPDGQSPASDDGRGGREVLYVIYDKFDYPTGQLRQQRAALGQTALWMVADSVVTALELLDRQFNRAHGALSESNVLIRSRVMHRGLAVGVGDPHPDDAGLDLSADEAYAADARMLGRLLFGLIEGRLPSRGEIEQGPALSSAFSRLGSGGKRWHATCCHLMRAGRDATRPDAQWRPSTMRAAIARAAPNSGGIMGSLRSLLPWNRKP